MRLFFFGEHDLITYLLIEYCSKSLLFCIIKITFTHFRKPEEHSSVQSLSHVWLFATQWFAARQASLSINNSRSSLRLTSIESVMPSSHLILCRPLLLLPPIPPSIRVLSSESTLRMRWPKYWSFSFSIIPSKEHPGLISFRMDWLDLLAVQGTLKSLLQHYSSKASILWPFGISMSCMRVIYCCFRSLLSQFARTTITKHHRPRGLTTEINFLVIPEGGSPRSRY